MSLRATLIGLLGVMALLSGCSSAETGFGPQTGATVATNPALLATGTARLDLGTGSAAPTFIAGTLDGAPVVFDSLRGRPVIVNFWMTTCEPCIREMPALADAARTGVDDELVVIGVNFREGPAVVVNFIESLETELDFPIAFDADGSIADKYEIVVFPTTYFIDGDGVIQYRRFGELRQEHLEVGLERILSPG